MPEAEIPKEHLRAIDKDHKVHDFQINGLQFSLSEVSVGVRAVSQIATALAVRELGFIVIINDIGRFTFVSFCIYKTRTKKF